MMLREIASWSTPLIAKASATSGEETYSWMLAPLFSSSTVGVLKIQPIPAVPVSDFHAASVLQRIAMFDSVAVSEGGCLLATVIIFGIWALSHSFARQTAMLKVMCGDDDLF